MTTTLPRLAETKLTCKHGSDVLECPTCTELLPASFWNRLTWKRFTPRESTIHVTSLTNCLRKAYLDTIVPAEETVESAWAKLRGALLHYAGRSLGWNELAVKMPVRIDDAETTIIGFIDAYDPETATIYDLKTTRLLTWQVKKGFIPRESHIAQVQCYSTMLEGYGIPVARQVLVYVDDKDIVPIQVPLGNRREWMILRATQLHRAFCKEQTPKPEVGSLCKYCPHLNACPQGEGADFREVMD